MEKHIEYSSFYDLQKHRILFKNLILSGGNIDKFILEGNLFDRTDHQYNILFKYCILY